MSFDPPPSRSAAPPPPAITRTVRGRGMQGGLRPPFVYHPHEESGRPERARSPQVEAATETLSQVEAPEIAARSAGADGHASGDPPEGPADTGEPVQRNGGEEESLADGEEWPELPDQGVAVAPWSADEDEAETGPSPHFPVDAFHVPADSERVPAGYDEAEYRVLSERVAARLEDTARTVRSGGLGALGATGSADELARLIAAVLAGYFAREQ